MITGEFPAPRGARWRARVSACAGGEGGDTLIEVLIATLLVALIAGAVLSAYASINHITGGQRKRTQAGELAQADEARLRGLTITQLSGTSATCNSNFGNTSCQVTIANTVYTVTSSAKFISGSSAGSACTTGPTTTTADEVVTASTVTWSPGNDGRSPVIVHGLVAPSEGGSLIVTAINQSGAGLAGLTATLSGPTTVSPLATDANGCSVFGGLDGGSYTITFTDPGYVDVNGSTPANQTLTVIPTETANAQELQLGLAGTITATYQTTYNGSTVAATGDQFVAVNSGIAAGYRGFGADSTSSTNTFASGLSTGSTMYPFATAYKVYAGGCNDPATPAAGQISALVSPGGSTPVVLPEPAMIVDVWTGQNSGSRGTLVTTRPDVTVTDTDTGCANNKDYPPSQIPTSQTVGALANPGLPYGNYTVCADAKIAGSYYYNTATVANTNYAVGNAVNIYLGAGSGATQAKCP